MSSRSNTELILYVFSTSLTPGSRLRIERHSASGYWSETIAYNVTSLNAGSVFMPKLTGYVLIWAYTDQQALELLANRFVISSREIIGKSYVKGCRWGNLKRYMETLEAYGFEIPA